MKAEMLDPDERRKLFSPIPAVPKQDAKRQFTTQPLPHSVVVLRGAVLPGEDRTHFYVAEAPLSPGINPLLLVIEGRDGSQEFRSVLALVPTWGVHVEPIDSLLYRAALGRVRAKHKHLITDPDLIDLLKLLPAKLVDGRHACSSIPLWLLERLNDFVEEAKENDVSTRLLSPISSLIRAQPHNNSSIVPWDVLHLQYDEPNIAIDPDWYIFSMWKSWMARRLSSRECFDEYIKHHRKHGTPNSFNGHLNYLGLPVPLKEGVKRRRERGWRLKQAVQKRENSEHVA